MPKPAVDLLQGTLDLLVLKTLSWGPAHGYAIARWIQQLTGAVLTVGEGSLYPALHRLENVLMLPSCDPSLFAGGAAVLDGATLAGVGPVAAQDQSVFLGCGMVAEPFTGGTNVNVLISHVAEVLLAEAPFRL